MFALTFWRAAGERALRTVAQTLLVLWAADGGFNVLSVDLGEAFGVGLGAGVLSVLTSIVAKRVSPDTGPSLGTEKPVPVGGRRKLGDVGETGAIDLGLALAAVGGAVALFGLAAEVRWVIIIGGAVFLAGVVTAVVQRR